MSVAEIAASRGLTMAQARRLLGGRPINLPVEIRRGWVDRDRVVQLYQSGMTIVEVAEELGCHPRTVHRTLIALDVPRRWTGPRLTGNREAIVELYLDGLSLIEVSESLGLSISTVRRHITRAGVTRGRGMPPRLDMEDVAQRYEAGQSVVQIADALGASKGGVCDCSDGRGSSCGRAARGVAKALGRHDDVWVTVRRAGTWLKPPRTAAAKSWNASGSLRATASVALRRRERPCDPGPKVVDLACDLAGLVLGHRVLASPVHPVLEFGGLLDQLVRERRLEPFHEPRAEMDL